MTLTESEIEELRSVFKDLVNYESDDIDDPINPLTYTDTSGDGCLHIAVQRSNLRAMGLLLKGGVDVNAKGDMGCTPLHYAQDIGNVEVIEFLLKNGAMRNIRNNFGILTA